MTLRFAARLLLATLLLAGCDHPPGGQPRAPHPDTVAIGAVQRRGDRSPLEGKKVHIEGVITRSIAEPVQGWFVQDAGDGDPATPDTVVVQTTTLTVEILADEVTTRIGNTVRIGDRIAVHGTVVELATGGTIGVAGSSDESSASNGTLTVVEALTVEVVSASAASVAR